MTEEIMDKVDKIFVDYHLHQNKKKLYKDLELYKFPSGAYSMYIRQCFDQLIL